MSQLRVMVNGKPDWLPEGPAYARRVGFGGSAMGTFSGTTFTVTRAPRGSVDEAAAAGHRSAAQQRAVERKRRARAAAKEPTR